MKQDRRSGDQNDSTAVPGTGKARKHINLGQLLKDGVITQEVYDAITNYLKEQVSQLPENVPAPADGTAPSDGSEPPALPEGTAPSDGSEPPALPEGAGESTRELLKNLLDSGVITQEQYDLLLKNADGPEGTAET